MYRAAIIVALGLAVGCKKTTEQQPAPMPVEGSAAPSGTPAAGAQSPAEEAQALFKTVCSVCHGEKGMGDGPGAAALTPKPRNYTDKAWQASVTDDQIANTILMGGAAVGKSPAMPAQPQLREKPEVVKELVRIVRGFAK